MDKYYNGIVVFGEMGSGKDSLAKQFSVIKKNSKIYNIGILCREIMKVSKVNPIYRGIERYIGQTSADKLREMDINIMCDYILALIYERGQIRYKWDNSSLEGDDFNDALQKQISILRKDELSIIVGGRTLTDVSYWKNKGYLLVGVKISDHIRKSRLTSRDGEATARNSDSNHNTEADLPLIINTLCDDVIFNDGTLDDLKKIAEKMLRKYNF